jgi:hypothetical protein
MKISVRAQMIDPTWGEKVSDIHEMYISLTTKKESTEPLSMHEYWLEDGDRRLGIERRRFSYSHHVPEKRTGVERRKKNGKRG